MKIIQQSFILIILWFNARKKTFFKKTIIHIYVIFFKNNTYKMIKYLITFSILSLFDIVLA
jgi:hypothetical protein